MCDFLTIIVLLLFTQILIGEHSETVFIVLAVLMAAIVIVKTIFKQTKKKNDTKKE